MPVVSSGSVSSQSSSNSLEHSHLPTTAPCQPGFFVTVEKKNKKNAQQAPPSVRRVRRWRTTLPRTRRSRTTPPSPACHSCTRRSSSHTSCPCTRLARIHRWRSSRAPPRRRPHSSARSPSWEVVRVSAHNPKQPINIPTRERPLFLATRQTRQLCSSTHARSENKTTTRQRRRNETQHTRQVASSESTEPTTTKAPRSQD
jgi:hypothetical protein